MKFRVVREGRAAASVVAGLPQSAARLYADADQLGWADGDYAEGQIVIVIDEFGGKQTEWYVSGLHGTVVARAADGRVR